MAVTSCWVLPCEWPGCESTVVNYLTHHLVLLYSQVMDKL